MSNSKVYGYYGSVYIPPSSIPFVPQPATVPFTQADKERLEQLVTQTEFYTQSAANILVRVEGEDPNTFVLTTSGHPENTIVLISDEPTVNLNIVDGGYA